MYGLEYTTDRAKISEVGAEWKFFELYLGVQIK